MFLIVSNWTGMIFLSQPERQRTVPYSAHTASKYANDPCKKEMVASKNFRKHGIRNVSSKSSIDKGFLKV